MEKALPSEVVVLSQYYVIYENISTANANNLFCQTSDTSSTLKAAKLSEEVLIIHQCILSENNTVGQFG